MKVLIVSLLVVLTVNQVFTSYKLVKASDSIDKCQLSIGNSVKKIANSL